jgi:hypothetical protein
MAHTFKTSSGTKTFKVFSESLTAGTYIENKKAKASYCLKNICRVNPNVGNQSNRILFNRAKLLNASQNKCVNSLTFDKTELYINLVTKLDLLGVDVIRDFSGNVVPSTISITAIPFIDYNIDPSGELFGNTVCGINNYVQYMKYNIDNVTA